MQILNQNNNSINFQKIRANTRYLNQTQKDIVKNLETRLPEFEYYNLANKLNIDVYISPTKDKKSLYIMFFDNNKNDFIKKDYGQIYSLPLQEGRTTKNLAERINNTLKKIIKL